MIGLYRGIIPTCLATAPFLAIQVRSYSDLSASQARVSRLRRHPPNCGPTAAAAFFENDELCINSRPRRASRSSYPRLTCEHTIFYCFSVAFLLLLCCFSIAVLLLFYCFSIAFLLLFCCFSIAFILLFYCFSIAFLLLFYCFSRENTSRG